MEQLKTKGAIAAGHRETAEAGAAMLRAGGTAIDAAIAGLAMACICEPVLASPGGGGFAMVRDGATGAIRLIDFFPQTPKQRAHPHEGGVHEVHADFGAATQRFHIGAATSAAPGLFPGMAALHALGARFPLTDLFAPAIAAGRNGVEVTAYQHYLSTVVRPILTATPEARALFAPDGELPQPGAVFKNPDLAGVFDLIARGDAGSKELGDRIIAQQSRDGGHLTRADLASYRTEDREPVCSTVDASRVFLNPLPAASGALIGHAFAKLEGHDPLSLAKALQEADVARLAANGDLARLAGRPIRQKGTTHISVADTEGNAVSVTVSNGEGNGSIVPDCGFMLNNILGEEDVNPFKLDWPLDTRLASMMCPAMIYTDDGGLVVLGSGGSSRIRSAIFLSVVRMTLLKQRLEEAVNAPRLHVEEGHLDFEDLLPEVDAKALKTAFPDHRGWAKRNMFFGGVHTVWRAADGSFDGFGDPRREGAHVIV